MEVSTVDFGAAGLDFQGNPDWTNLMLPEQWTVTRQGVPEWVRQDSDTPRGGSSSPTPPSPSFCLETTTWRAT
jgi:hypothetical protein